MRLVLVMVSAVAIACGGKGATRPPRPEVTWIGPCELHHVRQTLNDDRSESFEVLDMGDPSKVLLRIDHATGEAKCEEAGNTMLAIAVKGIRGDEAWRLVVYRDDPYDKRTTIVSAPPAFRKIEKWRDEHQKSVWGIAAGSDKDLYLPIDNDGKLVWFPEGVVGMKPVVPVTEIVGWLVRWQTPTPGWSFAKPDLSDIALDGRSWTTTYMKQFTNVPKHGGQVTFGFHAVVGAVPDGTCEVVPLVFMDHVNPRRTKGANCDDAFQRMLALYAAEDAADEVVFARLEAESRARLAGNSVEAAMERQAHEELGKRSEYERMVLGLGTDQSLPAAACTLATSMSFRTHNDVVVSRWFQKALLEGELDCLRQRARPDELEYVHRLEPRPAGSGAGTTTVSGGYAQSGPDALSAETAATAARTQQMIQYTYGRGGICPFDAYLCP